MQLPLSTSLPSQKKKKGFFSTTIDGQKCVKAEEFKQGDVIIQELILFGTKILYIQEEPKLDVLLSMCLNLFSD